MTTTGAAKRLGLSISQESAECLMNIYDTTKQGHANYYLMILDVSNQDPHFLTDATYIDKNSHVSSSSNSNHRVEPLSVSKGLERFKNACLAYSRKSQGLVQPRDLLYGSCLRYDKYLIGRIDYSNMISICEELGVRLQEKDMQIFIRWFDTNGTNFLDYNELTRQIFGDDILTKYIRLPSLSPSNENNKTKFSTINSVPASFGTGSSSISSMAVGMGSKDKRFGAWDQKPSRSGVGDLESGLLSMKTLQKNMQSIDSKIIKDAKKAIKKQIIMDEKIQIQLKLASIENQRKMLVSEHRAARAEKILKSSY